MSEVKNYSFAEELAHSITHGIGALLSIAGLAVLVAFAAIYGNAWHVVACSIFGATLVVMYMTSTLYHGIPIAEAKVVLRRLDHAAIYLLIAGTYTPFTLVTLRGGLGWSLFGVVWGLAILGVAFKLASRHRFHPITIGCYVAMGWLIIFALKPLVERLDAGGLLLLFGGGLCYMGGVLFYRMKKLRFHHAVWHTFVLGGSAMHYFAVLFFVIPS